MLLPKFAIRDSSQSVVRKTGAQREHTTQTQPSRRIAPELSRAAKRRRLERIVSHSTNSCSSELSYSPRHPRIAYGVLLGPSLRARNTRRG